MTLTLLLASLMMGAVGVVLTANLLIACSIAKLYVSRSKRGLIAVYGLVSFLFFSMLFAESFIALSYMQPYIPLDTTPDITQCFIQ